MAMGTEGSDRNLMSEINVTPFVDVMLVLLIIFMVTAPLLQEGIAVNLPKTDTAQVVEEKEKNVVLTVNKEGSIYIGKDEIKLAELEAKLKSTYEQRTNREIYLKGDQAADYGKVVQVMGIIQKIGGLKLGLITEQEIKK